MMQLGLSLKSDAIGEHVRRRRSRREGCRLPAPRTGIEVEVGHHGVMPLNEGLHLC
jgi:hypothetical protein